MATASRFGQQMCFSWLLLTTVTPISFDVFRQTRPRAAFVFLVHSSRTGELTRSLESLQQNFLSTYPGYQVLLFHNSPISLQQSIVPDNMRYVSWIMLNNFDKFPENYEWQDHPSQQHW